MFLERVLELAHKTKATHFDDIRCSFAACFVLWWWHAHTTCKKLVKVIGVFFDEWNAILNLNCVALYLLFNTALGSACKQHLRLLILLDVPQFVLIRLRIFNLILYRRRERDHTLIIVHQWLWAALATTDEIIHFLIMPQYFLFFLDQVLALVLSLHNIHEWALILVLIQFVEKGMRNVLSTNCVYRCCLFFLLPERHLLFIVYPNSKNYNFG